MNLTTKQIELIRVINEAPCDLDEILERVRYSTTKQSLQFSIRALIGHGLIEKKGQEKRRGRMRQVIQITTLGSGYGGKQIQLEPNPVISNVEDDELDVDMEILEA
ncbi:winged helix DNA-binding protein [Duganella sp. FT27W]|uniref:winged helix DNA-binding protein n=1 Tax=Duganella sp. FT27W TaxID=2654636 RepID=UPI001D046513|nr:winged helix DNA-binding protein [Duganella sp. FT27W]